VISLVGSGDVNGIHWLLLAFVVRKL
jgi:hypothetical protein